MFYNVLLLFCLALRFCSECRKWWLSLVFFYFSVLEFSRATLTFCFFRTTELEVIEDKINGRAGLRVVQAGRKRVASPLNVVPWRMR